MRLSTIPIIILLLLTGSTASYAQADSSETLEFGDQLPEFPGGDGALYRYLITNVRYPEQALKHGTKGTVFISCVITEEGYVSDVKVLKGVGDGLSEEAVRVIKAMPRWTPGKQDGKAVKVKLTIPIKFNIRESKPSHKTKEKKQERKKRNQKRGS